ncbi:hypothetical protein [Paludisphaera mucosa]|uniref:Uncharacterized protein n=1 Tax=Paludisphaera mucosa TaxID=3030827 RepID=A0ABT6FLF8_9BACT|nr:hypothetical protein [Paludisphaera mucosa]MDG3008354.1 hypothetical protein [Paludisphaera mucosa]
MNPKQKSGSRRRRFLGEIMAIAGVGPAGLLLLSDKATAFQQPALRVILNLPGDATIYAGLALPTRQDFLGNTGPAVYAAACQTPVYLVVFAGKFIDPRNHNQASLVRVSVLGVPDESDAHSLSNASPRLSFLEFYNAATRTLIRSNDLKSVEITSENAGGPTRITAKATVTLAGASRNIGIVCSRNADQILNFEIRDLTSNLILGTGMGEAGRAGLATGGIPVRTTDVDGTIQLFDPSDGSLLEVLPLKGQKGGAVADGSDVWQIVYDEAKLYRLDANAGGGVEGSIPLPAGRWGGIALNGQEFWLQGVRAGRQDYSIVRIRKSDGVILSEMAASPLINGLAWVNGRLYASLNGQELSPPTSDSAIVTLDPTTGESTSRFNLPAGSYPHDLEPDGQGGLLVLVSEGDRLDGPLTVQQFTP